jgi:hypothetical protein
MRKKKKPSWYTVVCHFRSFTEGKPKDKTQLWEETFVLVSAISRKHAARKATRLARKRRRSYSNFAGVVTWRFAEVTDVCALTAREFGEGTEVYSRFFGRKRPLSRLAQSKP